MYPLTGSLREGVSPHTGLGCKGPPVLHPLPARGSSWQPSPGLRALVPVFPLGLYAHNLGPL